MSLILSQIRHKQAQRRAASGTPPYIRELFREQRSFVDDPARYKAALCGRRAGKTRAVAADLLADAARHPGSLGVYIALSRQSAKDLCWAAIEDIDQRFRLGLRYNRTELVVQLPNRSKIKLFGAEEVRHIERIRGLKLRRAYIDEAASFRPHIKRLIEDILEPCLLDENGTLGMIGSPGIVPTGFFFDITTGREGGWSLHSWNVLQNPHIPHARAWIEDKKRTKGWADDNPILIREYLGRWVSDKTSLVYPYGVENVFDVLDDGPWEHVIGIDLGFRDATAFSVGAFLPKKTRNLYVVHAEKESALSVTDIVNKVKALQATYEPISIVCDTGGSGALNIVEEIRKIHGIDIDAAEKVKKRQYIELLVDDLRTKRLLVKQGLPLLTEWDSLAWNEDKEEEDPRCENHLADATLYMWRKAFHWLHEEEEKKPDKNTDEYYKALEEEMEQSVIDALERKERKERDEIDYEDLEDEAWWEQSRLTM